jgi:hypothetical protein
VRRQHDVDKAKHDAGCQQDKLGVQRSLL